MTTVSCELSGLTLPSAQMTQQRRSNSTSSSVWLGRDDVSPGRRNRIAKRCLPALISGYRETFRGSATRIIWHGVDEPRLR